MRYFTWLAFVALVLLLVLFTLIMGSQLQHLNRQVYWLKVDQQAALARITLLEEQLAQHAEAIEAHDQYVEAWRSGFGTAHYYARIKTRELIEGGE